MTAISTNKHDKVYNNERLKESMEKEGCILMTPYENTKSYVKYIYTTTMFTKCFHICGSMDINLI